MSIVKNQESLVCGGMWIQYREVPMIDRYQVSSMSKEVVMLTHTLWWCALR